MWRGDAKPRGWPDRRGMGAQSDFIGEQFVPSESYKVQQLARARELLASGVDAEELAKMFLVPVDQLTKAAGN